MSNGTKVLNRDLKANRLYLTTSQTETRTSGILYAVSANVLLETTGVSALTLADGEQGQRLFIVMTVDNGDVVITPSNAAGFTTMTFDTVGDSTELIFNNGKWASVNRSVTFA